MQIDRSFGDFGMIVDSVAIQKYVSRRKEEVLLCLLALQQSDFETLRDVAHKILGNYATFGFSELEGIALDLQHAARKSEFDSAQLALKKLETWAEMQGVGKLATH